MKGSRDPNPNNYRRLLQEQIDQQEAAVAAVHNAPVTEGTDTVDQPRDSTPGHQTQGGVNPRVDGDLPSGAPIQVPVQAFLPPVDHDPRPETPVSTDQRPADQTQPTPDIGGRVALFSLPPRRPDIELRSRLDRHRARFEPTPAEGQPSDNVLHVHRPPSPLPARDDYFDDTDTIQHNMDSLPLPFMMDAVHAVPRYLVQGRIVFMTSTAMETTGESRRSVLRVRRYRHHERRARNNEGQNGGDEASETQTPNENFPDDGLGLIPEEIYGHFLLFGNMQTGMAQRDIERRFPARECHYGDESPECCICLCDLEEGNLERQLPCHHTMHAACIDRWFESHLQCPMCRRDARL